LEGYVRVANFREFHLLTVTIEKITQEMLRYVRALKSVIAESYFLCAI